MSRTLVALVGLVTMILLGCAPKPAAPPAVQPQAAAPTAPGRTGARAAAVRPGHAPVIGASGHITAGGGPGCARSPTRPTARAGRRAGARARGAGHCAGKENGLREGVPGELPRGGGDVGKDPPRAPARRAPRGSRDAQRLAPRPSRRRPGRLDRGIGHGRHGAVARLRNRAPASLLRRVRRVAPARGRPL